MNQEEMEIRRELMEDFEHYASKCLVIRSKSSSVTPFKLNKAQKYIHEIAEDQKRRTGKVRIIVVKGRQLGISTYIEGRFYWLVTHTFGARAFILTHDAEATRNLFEMAKRYHDNCPEIVRPEIQSINAKELSFSVLDSGYKIGTAGNKGVGRSSTIQFLHGSEIAFWPHASEHAKGILQAVPNEKGTEIFFESTANGVGNYFYEQWQQAESGQSDFIPVFIPWFWQDEYRRPIDKDFNLTPDEIELCRMFKLDEEQINWRRYKIIELSAAGVDGEKAFLQEYPNVSSDAFQSTGEDGFIKPDDVMYARKAFDVEPYGDLVVGVDPARFGNDRTAIIRRKGRVAYNLQTYCKKDTMEIVGLVNNIIEAENPYKVCIDIGGLGAGIYDRLRELGHSGVIIPVNSGATPLDANRYLNKRAEMWGLMNQWLKDTPVSIPDTDELQADLCNTRYKIDSNSRIVMEKKEDMKKRHIRSSDAADALCLTFACPTNSQSSKLNETKAQKVMSHFAEVQQARMMSRGRRK